MDPCVVTTTMRLSTVLMLESTISFWNVMRLVRVAFVWSSDHSLMVLRSTVEILSYGLVFMTSTLRHTPTESRSHINWSWRSLDLTIHVERRYPTYSTSTSKNISRAST